MLGEELLPGVNNATADFGIFCLGVWIPWKFRRLCQDRPASFTPQCYRAFREAMESVITFVCREGSPAEQRHGAARRRIGAQNLPPLPGPLTFAAAERTVSLYSAPQYGPS